MLHEHPSIITSHNQLKGFLFYNTLPILYMYLLTMCSCSALHAPLRWGKYVGRIYVLDPHDTPPLNISVKLPSIMASSSPQCFLKDRFAYNIYQEGWSSTTVIGMCRWKPLRMHHIQQWIQCTWKGILQMLPRSFKNLYQTHILNHHTPQLSYVMIELKQVVIMN